MVRNGVKYLGYYRIDGESLRVSTETGTLTRPLGGRPVKEFAEQLLAKLVQEELQSLK
jgi:hypothetical protein